MVQLNIGERCARTGVDGTLDSDDARLAAVTRVG